MGYRWSSQLHPKRSHSLQTVLNVLVSIWDTLTPLKYVNRVNLERLTMDRRAKPVPQVLIKTKKAPMRVKIVQLLPTKTRLVKHRVLVVVPEPMQTWKG